MARKSPVDAARATRCLLGGALGDALGYPLEFDRGRDILQRFGSGDAELGIAIAVALSATDFERAVGRLVP